jgi:hypothetical protein
MYKEQYGNKLNDVVPTSSVVYDLIKFDEDNKLGDSYRQSVTLTSEHGVTYNGSGGGQVALAAAVPATIKEGNSSGFEMIVRSKMTYAAASRAVTSKQAFAQGWGTVLLNLRKASMKRAELTFLRGQLGLGVVSAIGSGVITITDATWSPTTWAGMEGALLEAFTTNAATATQHDTTLTITAVSFANKTVTVSGTSSSVAPGDYLFFKGAKTTTGFSEGVGLLKIAQNSGSLFGIDAATYALWAGNTKSSFGIPTMGRFLDAATQAVDKGLDEKCHLLVNPKSWEVMNSDLSAQRMYDGSYSKAKAENGSQRIAYYGQMGEMEVATHPFLQRGEAVLFPKTPYKRIGSADVGMGVPGLSHGGERDIFFHIEADNVVEARTFMDQSMFCDGPSTSCYISGITYAS